MNYPTLLEKKRTALENKRKKAERASQDGSLALRDFFRQIQAKRRLASPRCIRSERWEELLGMDKVCLSEYPVSRREIFSAAFVLQLEKQEVMELLQAAGTPPYQVRNPREYIDFFCMGQPGASYEKACRLYLVYEDAVRTTPEGAVANTGTELPLSAAPAPGATRLLRNYQEQLQTSPLSEEKRDENLLSFMIGNRREFGLYSRTAREMLLRFADYLSMLYPPVAELIDPVSQSGQGRLVSLAQEIYQHVEWPLSEYRARESRLQPQAIDTAAFIREFEGFCTANLPHLARIEQDGSEPVTRRDIILLAFFFVYGYLWNAAEETRTKICDLAFGADPSDNAPQTQFDWAMQETIGQYLDNYLEDPEAYDANHLHERISWFTSCMNTFLEAFGLEKFYAPSPFDRLFLLLFLPGGDGSLDLATTLIHND